MSAISEQKYRKMAVSRTYWYWNLELLRVGSSRSPREIRRSSHKTKKDSKMLRLASQKVSRPLASLTAKSMQLPLLAQRRDYHEKIVEHYENPRNVGSLDKNDDNVGTVRLFLCLFSVSGAYGL